MELVAAKCVLHFVISRFPVKKTKTFSLFFGVKVLHIQNPGKMQAFGNVAGWLKETTGTDLEGVTLDEFRERIDKAVEEKAPHDASVLAKVCFALESTPVLINMLEKNLRMLTRAQACSADVFRLFSPPITGNPLALLVYHVLVVPCPSYV